MYLNAVGGSRGQKNKLSSDESTIKNEPNAFYRTKKSFSEKMWKNHHFSQKIGPNESRNENFKNLLPTDFRYWFGLYLVQKWGF